MFKRSFPAGQGHRVYFRLYPRGWLIFLLTLGAASAICALPMSDELEALLRAHLPI